MTVSVVISAYNEATRIAGVATVAADCDFVNEVIVVDDGSDDGTAAVAAKCYRTHVLRLPINCGKGAAIHAGARLAQGEIVLLLDADLSGITAQHLWDLIHPVASGEARMTIGVLQGGNFWSDAGQGVSPALSGQRALMRSDLLGVEGLSGCRMGAEVLINQAIREKRGRKLRINLEGVGHSLKEQKMGWRRGLSARGRMYQEIGRTMLRMRRRKRPTKGVRT